MGDEMDGEVELPLCLADDLDDPTAPFVAGAVAFSHSWGGSSVVVYEYRGIYYAYPGDDGLGDVPSGQGFANLDDAIATLEGLTLTDASEQITWPALSVHEVVARLECFNNETIDVIINGELVTVEPGPGLEHS